MNGSRYQLSLAGRRYFAGLVLAACAVLVAAPAAAVASSAPPVSVPSATLMTMDGAPLWSRNPEAPRPVASTIKMLNALVVRDHANLDDVVVVPEQAADIWDGGVGLVAGQKVTVRQLLQMMLVASANDAAETLAIHIGGSEKKYVAMMNAKAKNLGLTHTHAADPHGLGKRERSTANDLSVLARNVMADPVLREIVSHGSVRVPRPKGKGDVYGTTDGLMGNYRGIEGVKTGYTDPAGYCFVGAAKRGDVELLGVVLGADSNQARFSEMRKLLDWGFAHYRASEIVSREVTMGVVGVGSGLEPTVTVHAARALSVAHVDGGSITTTAVWLPTSVQAPVAPGQQLGTIDVCRNGVVFASVPLVADCAVSVRPNLPEPASVASRIRESHPRFWARFASLSTRVWRSLAMGLAHI